MSYTHEWNDNGVCIKYYDTLTPRDLIMSNSQLVGKPEFERIKFIITDFCNITNIEISEKDVTISTSFAEKANPYNKNIKVALVSDKDELQPLIENYIEKTLALVPHAQQRLFSNLNEAKIWVSGN